MTLVWSLWQQLSVYTYLHFATSETIHRNPDISSLPKQRIIHTEAPQVKKLSQYIESKTNYPSVHNHSKHKDRSWDFSSLSACKGRGEMKTETAAAAKKRIIREALWIFSKTIFQQEITPYWEGQETQSRNYYEKLSTQTTAWAQEKWKGSE